MEKFISNFHKVTRRETLHGRDFIVAPVTLIVPGVLKGSQGALFYPKEQIAKNVDSWNGMPLTIRHPADSSGHSLSGRSPAVNEKQGIGTLYNSHIENDKLVGEAWFDLETTRNLSPDIASKLEANQQIELSTGLFTDNVKAPKNSSFEGVPFTHIAKNYRPDHLAILPDQVGACSLDDGCGVLNEDVSKNDSFLSEKGGEMPKLTEKQRTEHVAEIIKNCEYCDESDAPALNGLSDEKLLSRKAAQDKMLANQLVINALQDFAGTDDSAELTEFVVNKAEAEKNAQDAEEEKKKKAALFVKKNKGKKAKNQDEEEEEEELVKTKEQNAKPRTDEELVAALPQRVQNTLKYAGEIVDREKQHLIDLLVANVEDDTKKKAVVNRLKDKELDELRDLAVLAPTSEGQNETPPISFFGAQGSAPAVQNSDGFDQEDILKSPTWNFGEEN